MLPKGFIKKFLKSVKADHVPDRRRGARLDGSCARLHGSYVVNLTFSILTALKGMRGMLKGFFYSTGRFGIFIFLIGMFTVFFSELLPTWHHVEFCF